MAVYTTAPTHRDLYSVAFPSVYCSINYVCFLPTPLISGPDRQCSLPLTSSTSVSVDGDVHVVHSWTRRMLRIEQGTISFLFLHLFDSRQPVCSSTYCPSVCCTSRVGNIDRTSSSSSSTLFIYHSFSGTCRKFHRLYLGSALWVIPTRFCSRVSQ